MSESPEYWVYLVKIDDWEKGEVSVREFTGLVVLSGGDVIREDHRASGDEIARRVLALAYNSWADPLPERLWHELNITVERRDHTFEEVRG